MKHLFFFAAFGVLLLSAQASQAEPITKCVPKGNARPICEFANPEDMIALPGGQAILIGELGRSRETGGQLVVFELESEKRHTLFRGGQGKGAEPGWGDPNCTTPPGKSFSALGLDLVRRDDGRLQLLVTQNGSRIAVELFEVMGASTDWRAEWRGCVLAPPNAILNGIAGVSNGDFYTTKYRSLDSPIDFKNDGLPTSNTGYVYAWSQSDTSFRKIDGTDGIMPNGIVTSADGRFVYVNMPGENNVRKFEVATGRELGRVELDMPDNSHWGPDGNILIASVRKEGVTAQDLAACEKIERGACNIPFKIVALDPDSMSIVEILYETEGAPMGAGTSAARVGDELFIGSVRSDRILRVNLLE